MEHTTYHCNVELTEQIQLRRSTEHAPKARGVKTASSHCTHTTSLPVRNVSDFRCGVPVVSYINLYTSTNILHKIYKRT
jgi:hypothetical protein